MNYIYLVNKNQLKVIIDKQQFYKFVSNINVTNKFVSYSYELNENIYSSLVKKIINSPVNLVYWNNPSQNFSFIALGEICSVRKKNKYDNQELQDMLTKVKKNHYHNLNKINFNRIPLFVGAHKFPLTEKSDLWSDYEFEKWLIPKYLLFRKGNFYSVIINYIKSDFQLEKYLDDFETYFHFPDNEQQQNANVAKAARLENNNTSTWNEIILTCLEKISKKELEKVVIARKIELEIDSRIDFSDVAKSLEKTYPKCYTFIYRNSGSTFFGATPEKLFGVDKGIIETDALAGSIQRGKSEIADKELGLELLESEKDIIEHNSVRNFLLEKLYHVTENIVYDSAPRLRKLSNIQHLWTQITAKLKDDIDILSLIENIYPTPAICGYPTDTALKLIGGLENFDRGLYAGIIGWFNFDNEGEFAVALRSALLKNNTIHAFAGCGIVEGSNPIFEYNETELKLKPILSLFVNETINQP